MSLLQYEVAGRGREREGERKRGRDGEAGRRRKEGRSKIGCEGQRL